MNQPAPHEQTSVTYADAVAYLMGLLDPGHSRVHSRDVTLTRTARLLDRLGHPERDVRAVLVAGTKGKGSTAAMLAAIQHAAGRRVGLYTKPHLVDYRERIGVDFALIGEADLAALVERIRPAVEAGAGDPEGLPTYFEASVALALLHFQERAVDLAVLEVGLGGRLDATNVCDPIVSVVTPISYDHVDRLGRTLQAIALEKAGIVRSGRPLVAAPQPDEVETVLRAVCAQVGARFVAVGERARWTHKAMSSQGQVFSLQGATDYGDIRLPLIGRHQMINAATAVVTTEELGSMGLGVSVDAVRRGLQGLRWPGRVEVVQEHPTVVVDVAHNEASMQALRDALTELWPGRRMILVYGMVGTHDHESVTGVIAPLAAVAVVTVPRHVHALAAQSLADVVRQYTPRVEVVEDRVRAVEHALGLAGPDDLVCVTGSFFLVGEARAHLLRRHLGEVERVGGSPR